MISLNMNVNAMYVPDKTSTFALGGGHLKASIALVFTLSNSHVSSGCARYRSVYVCITVKGSRICEHCNELAVRKYVRANMV